jgi:hypothetical protein
MALIPNTQKFHTVASTVDTENKGSAQLNAKREAFTMQDIADTVGGVDSSVSVYVKADGTPQENGVALLAAYTDAASKSIDTRGITNYVAGRQVDRGNGQYYIFDTVGVNPADVAINVNYTVSYGTVPAQTLVWRIEMVNSSGALAVYITDTSGNPQDNLVFDFTQIPVYGGTTKLSYLMIGPGDYEIPSNLVVEDLVSITSLTGERDVHIYGANVIIKPEANFDNIFYANLLIGDDNYLYIEEGLSLVTFKNIKSTNFSSFSSEAGGANQSSTFIDCHGGSFGQGVGKNASGTFINCIGSNGFAGGSGSISSGYFEGCSIDGGDFPANGGFGSFTTQCGGTFINCTAGDNAFGHNSDDVIAYFENCRAYGQNNFGSGSDKNSGTFINCHGFVSNGGGTTGSNFGSNNTSSVDADTDQSKYYYCTSAGNDNFGYSPTANQSSRGTYIGCISEGNGFGSTAYGVVINCVTGGSFATSGSGIIRNSIDGSYNTINLN